MHHVDPSADPSPITADSSHACWPPAADPETLEDRAAYSEQHLPLSASTGAEPE